MRIDRREFLKGAIGAAAAVNVATNAQSMECSSGSSTTRSRNSLERKSKTVGGVAYDLYEIDKSDLDYLAIVPQCLDNQWVSISLLKKIISNGKSRSHYGNILQDSVRSEYIRSLVNSEQVVINRAFFQNNPQIFRDFRNVDKLELETFDENRDSFKRLLSAGAIVPYLFDETAPVGEQRFRLNDDGSQAWGCGLP